MNTVILRPRNCQQCEDFLKIAIQQTMQLLEPNTAHAALWKGTDTLLNNNFFDLVVKPLYGKNMVVQIAFHTLIPVFEKFLRDPANFNKSIDKINEKDMEKRKKKYASLSDNLVKACEIHEKRCKNEKIAPDMIDMRKTLELFTKINDIYIAFELLYVSSHAARIVWSIMLPRLVVSLKQDNAIEESKDIPMELIAIPSD